MKKINIITACMLGLSGIAPTSCSDVADEVTSLVFGRNFAPVGLEASSITESSASLKWTQSSGATSYNIEVFANDSLTFEGTAVQSINVSTEDIPYHLAGLEYDTKYSVRVMALDEKDASRNSKWSTVYFRTSAQQILKSMKTQDVTDKTVDLSWPAEETDVTTLKVFAKTDNSLVTTHTITDEEKAAGKATVEGLKAETEYVGRLYFGERERGNKSFKTIADLNGATVVKESDDLKSLLSKAEAGQVFAPMPGSYLISSADDDGKASSVALKASVVIKGIYPTDKPVIQGRFEIKGATSVEISNVVLDGTLNNTEDQAFNFKDAGDLEKLVVSNTEIIGKTAGGYAKGICYVNVAAKIGEITFSDCDIHDIQCDGGDFIDCRKGYIGALNLKNCTFYNSCVARDFIRYDDAKLGSETVITVDHCTINGVSNSKKRLLYVRNACSKIIWSNNLVTNTGAVWSNQSSTTVPEFSNNVYNACTILNTLSWAEGKGDNAFTDGTATVADPKYKDASKGDFTITNDAVSKLKVGAEKWYTTE